MQKPEFYTPGTFCPINSGKCGGEMCQWWTVGECGHIDAHDRMADALEQIATALSEQRANKE